MEVLKIRSYNIINHNRIMHNSESLFPSLIKNMTVLTRFNSFLNTFCICPKEVCNSSFLNSFSEFLFISQFLLNCTKIYETFIFDVYASCQNSLMIIMKKKYILLINISNDSSNFTDIENYFINNKLILSEINDEKFDLITFTIENVNYENKSTCSLIKFIYDKFKNTNINYTFVLKNITKN
ncbi:hypothetical protein H8356DRAFT_1354406 [Neocallimastix lanati (nom. inval.)]|nr:hypothetical protein H8356DRAFT_1354406 [Neocallimastix sp. JGI-2020a]